MEASLLPQGDNTSTESVDPVLVLAQKKFLCKSTLVSAEEKQQLQKDILDVVFKQDMTAVYKHICGEIGWPIDSARVDAMAANNDAKMKELQEKLKTAEETEGETEVRDALIAIADHLATVGDREAAAEAYGKAEKQTAVAGLKLDMVLRQIRLDVLYGKWHEIKSALVKAQQLCEAGGDWERKNKLKVYNALYAMAVRDFKTAANLLLESVATFTSYELFSYETCIFYAVVTSIVSLDRVTLKKRVVDSPEILTVMDKLPHVSTYLNALYGCRYGDFFQAFVAVVHDMQRDMLLAQHVSFYMKQVRIMVYTQFLESYKSVTLQSMASAFGVGIDFLDREMADLIANGVLNAKIDRVAGVIETNRPDNKNALYQTTLKQGDLLLNRIQKLSKVIDVE